VSISAAAALLCLAHHTKQLRRDLRHCRRWEVCHCLCAAVRVLELLLRESVCLAALFCGAQEDRWLVGALYVAA
jgi:hypothetical protein